MDVISTTCATQNIKIEPLVAVVKTVRDLQYQNWSSELYPDLG